MQPPFLVHALVGGHRIVVVAAHDHVAASAYLAGFTSRDYLARLGVHDLHLGMRHGPADGRNPLLQGIIGGGHGDAGRGLRLAVGDHHLSHIHEGAHLLHELNGAGRSSHDSRSQAGEIVFGKIGVLKLRDEHGGHSVHSSAALLLDGRHDQDGIEVLGRQHHCRPVRHAGQIGEHHAKAMVKGNRYAKPVGVRKLHAFADEVAVVQDVMVRENHALRETGCARGILNVNGIVKVKALFPLLQNLIGHLFSHLHHIIPGPHARLLLAPDHDCRAEEWQLLGVNLARLSRPGLGTDLVEHLHVVRAFKVVHEQQGLCLRLTQSILQFVRPVGGVDVHHDDARFCRGELGDDPFRQVCGPYSEAVALLEAQSDETLRGAVQLLLQFAIGVSRSLVDGYNCVAIRVFFRYFIEHIADGLSNKRFLRAAKSIAVRDFACHEVAFQSLRGYNSILRQV